jgi:ABC-type uncharacterized transport system permease subunit
MLGSVLRRNYLLYIFMMSNEARRYLSYPIEVISTVLKRLLAPLLFIVFWFAVGSHSSAVSPKDLISYSLVASGLTKVFISDFSIATMIQKMIKYGEISHMMLRPMSLILQPFAKYAGHNIADGFVNVAFVIGGLVIGGASWSTVGYLPFVVVNALLINISFNLLLGSLGFYTPGASSIKNTLHHFAQLLRGSTVPFYLIAPIVIKVLNYTPFPASMYHVVLALRGRNDLLKPADVAIGFVWALILFTVSTLVWRRSSRRYEAVGL